jgi:cytochrome c-type biogenesis protein CcmF
VTEKRGSFKSWTVLLAISAFSLSLLGTFLVRSGVITSVHSFATDPTRGTFILGLLTFYTGVALALYAWRASKVGLGARFSMLSRETLLLGNNVLLVVATIAVMLGTLYPLFLDALGLGKISVGPPYFDAVFVPIMAPLVFLMGVGPMARWKQAELPDLWQRLRWAGVVAVLATLLAGFVGGQLTFMSLLGLLMAFWVLASLSADLWERVRPVSGLPSNMLGRLRQLPRAYWGMTMAHLGIGVFVFGVTMVNTYEVERDLKMQVGQSTTIRGYTFTFQGVTSQRGPNYDAAVGHLEVTRDGRMVADMYPEKRMYTVQRMPMTEAAIDTSITRDLYVSLGEVVEDGAWIVRVYVKPFIDWIWGGCALMGLGGLLAASDRRYRIKATSTARDGVARAS